jgi:hypothetical protein
MYGVEICQIFKLIARLPPSLFQAYSLSISLPFEDYACPEGNSAFIFKTELDIARLVHISV